MAEQFLDARERAKVFGYPTKPALPQDSPGYLLIPDEDEENEWSRRSAAYKTGALAVSSAYVPTPKELSQFLPLR